MESRSLLSVVAHSDTERLSREVAHTANAEQAGKRRTIHAVTNGAADSADHFIERDGLCFAGTHPIIDFWNASDLDNTEIVEGGLRAAAAAAGATLMKLDLHRFSSNGGIPAVAMLAESHILIHTLPERTYAVDVFMCGDADPRKSINILRHVFSPRMPTVSEHMRAAMP
jgi:S-adenosylmethionine decarboxylase